MDLKKEGAEPCKHSVVFSGLCAVCGGKVPAQNVRKRPSFSDKVSLLHDKPNLLLAKDYARTINNEHQLFLKTSKKLVLILDLDHTIIHSSQVRYKDRDLIHRVNNSNFVVLNETNESTITFNFNTNKNVFVSEGTCTKIRRHTKSFLEKMSEFFELHVFTMGTRSYASKVLDYLDGDRSLFGNRVKTRDESTLLDNKLIDMHSLFLGDTDMLVILDDRKDVWRNCSNLIQLFPFYQPAFFDSLDSRESAEANSHNRVYEILVRSCLSHFIDEEVYLFDLQDFFIKTHGIYYSDENFKSVPKIIEHLKSKILCDFNIYYPAYNDYIGSFDLTGSTSTFELYNVVSAADSILRGLGARVYSTDVSLSKANYIVLCDFKSLARLEENKKVLQRIKGGQVRVVHVFFVYCCNYRLRLVEAKDFDMLDEDSAVVRLFSKHLNLIKKFNDKIEKTKQEITQDEILFDEDDLDLFDADQL